MPLLLLLAPCSMLHAQVVVQPPGIRAVLAGPGITVNTNGFTRTISAPGAAGDITGGAVTGGLLTVAENAGILTYGLTTNAVNAAVDVLARIADQTIAPDRIEGDGTLTIVGTDGMYIQADASGLSPIEVSGITTTNSIDAATINATDAITIGGTNVLTDASDLNASNLTNLVITVPVSDWHGPRDTERPGWAYKSYATINNTTRLCAGMFEYGTTQYTATLDAYFTVPPEATAWKTTGAIVLKLLGDSTTSSDVKYRLYVYRDGTSAAIYDSTANQVLTSTSGITTISIPASSLGTIAPGTTYTVRLEPSVRNSLALYIHSITVQVLK